MPLSLASRATKYLDRTPLVAVDAASTAKVDHRRVAKLQSVLRARHDTSAPSPPANTADGRASGYLLHQAKFQSQWKRSFFVLKGCTLYQYASEAAARPNKSFAVSYAVRERFTDDELDLAALW